MCGKKERKVYTLINLFYKRRLETMKAFTGPVSIKKKLTGFPPATIYYNIIIRGAINLN